MKTDGSLLRLLKPCGDQRDRRMSLREIILFYSCCALFGSWLGMAWCLWIWYEVAQGALKLLEIAPPQ